MVELRLTVGAMSGRAGAGWVVRNQPNERDIVTTTTTTPTALGRHRRASTALERRLAIAAGIYAGLGLLAGLFYRTLTHGRAFTGPTVLSLGHTHFLALGMLVCLLVLVLEREFGLSRSGAFRWFEPLYHTGLLITAGALIVRGTLQVVASNPTWMAFAGVAGLGHILLTAAIVVLLLALRSALADGNPTVER